ncbi:kinase-like protein [Lichtheimia hyalospora FSU 10163]|nr:kinase-like protein [Lichtheimia hyalospora FSU 10163]
MPLRHVADQFRNKWRRSTSKTDDMHATGSAAAVLVSARTSIDTTNVDSATKQRQPISLSSGQKHNKHQQTPVPVPATNNNPSSQPPLAPNPDYALDGIGEYVFLEQLGHGKFSKVMLAQHYQTGDKYAVKIIDKRLHGYRILSRLVREITLMESLDHPNVVHLYETFETADSLYLVMEYVRGVNLDEYLQQSNSRGALKEDEARHIFRQIVAAVDYCHSQYVVHRDLKAPNVLLMPDGQVRLADFGLGNRFGLQRLKTICGSMLYYSPEIITGQKYVGPEVDCWCLGILLYRMTVGSETFGHARTVGELKKDVVGANYPMPDHLSDDLQRTIRKCLTLDRRRRLGVRQVLDDDAWLSNHGALPSPFQQIDAAVEDTTRVRVDRERLRRQYLRDMEERGRSGMLPTIRKTVMYHPINASIYFTGVMQHSPSLEESLRTKELMRADLYKEIRVIINQVRLRPIANASMKAPLVQHILQKFKRGSNNSSSIGLSTHQSIRRSTSILHFSHLYKKAAKDHVSYYSIECNVRAVSSTTAVSSNASNDIPTPSIPIPSQLPYTTHHQDEYELILLVRSACELLGITYRHESRTRLVCVLTLRNYREDPGQFKEKHYHHQARRASSQMTSGGTSEHTSSVLSDNSWASKLKRLSLPMLSNHFHNHNQQQARIWSNSIQINSSATPASVASGQQHYEGNTGVNAAESSSATSQQMTSSEDGTAMFAIEAFAIQPTKQQQQQHRVVALRYSYVNGSTKVYKLATGWVGGVLSSTKTVGA